MDFEAFVATAMLRFAAGQRHVDLSSDASRWNQLVYGKALSNRFDSPERCKQRWQSILRNAEHLDVHVFRRPTAEAIAHPAANDERTAADRCRALGDPARDFQLVSHTKIIFFVTLTIFVTFAIFVTFVFQKERARREPGPLAKPDAADKAAGSVSYAP